MMYKNLGIAIWCPYHGSSFNKAVVYPRRSVPWGAAQKNSAPQLTERLEEANKAGVMLRLNFYFLLLSTPGAKGCCGAFCMKISLFSLHTASLHWQFDFRFLILFRTLGVWSLLTENAQVFGTIMKRREQEVEKGVICSSRKYPYLPQGGGFF